MKVIGRGWQYTVYDLGNGRVLKRLNSASAAFFIMLHDSFPYIRHPLWKMPAQYREAKQIARASITKIHANNLKPWMLANPQVVTADSYEQDMVEPLRPLFKKATPEEGKKRIDQFVDFCKVLVTHSCIDKSFDIANNFGVDREGRMVLIDLGELYTNREQIVGQIRSKIWSSHYVLSGLPPALHTYFLESMERAFATQDSEKK